MTSNMTRRRFVWGTGGALAAAAFAPAWAPLRWLGLGAVPASAGTEVLPLVSGLYMPPIRRSTIRSH